ncbi:UDP-glucuronic acid decarboxylase family protein [Novosphingobium terrae]|uniref:UDP-glucuronic acid decarboxylase family protein n=1 Tax=Novosphingobium terrae TaxID=2726189 RepID=UPI001F12E618|nr:UDP-glucuronic acid decarboxylase family protein [Novosphingobium terrae]
MAKMMTERAKIERAKTVLITGGAGFLGSHLAERLLGQGHQVFCLDNFQSGRRANLTPLLRSNRLTIVAHDMIHPLPDLPRFDEIYNLACPASPVHYQEDPVATMKVCSVGVLNMLERAARDNARVFHTSTSEIYGDPEIHPQHESYHGNVNTIGPRSCYDEGKRFAETLLTEYAAQSGLNVRLVRIFNTYGPRMQPDDGRVVSNFIVQALRGEKITIYGDGSQTRSFCYVDDLIDGIQLLMAADDRASGPMNIGNPGEYTVGELASLIVEMVGSRSSIVYKPLPIDDPRRRRPDISRAQALLGWSPKVDLVSGLEKTISYFRRRFDEAISPDFLAAIPPLVGSRLAM